MGVLRKLLIPGVTAAVVYFGLTAASYTDTVVMKNKEYIKGVVVEEYKDRIVLSTVDGEKQIMRKDIANIMFDLEEQNLTNIGDRYQDRKLYKKAYYYYQRALEINPYYKRAKDGLNYVQTYLVNGGRADKLRYIQSLNEQLKGREGALVYDMQEKDRHLRDGLGITLKNVGRSYVITSVSKNSPAEKAGIKKGDVLSVIWGRPVKYMEPIEVMNRLLDPTVMDSKLVIERSYMLRLEDRPESYTSLVGIKLDFSEMEGLEVKKVSTQSAAEKAGIKEGDIILEVQGKSTRYMPLKDVENIIYSRRGKDLALKTSREVVIWKKFIDYSKS